MEDGLTARLVQVGVRTLTPHLAAQAARFGVESYGMDRWRDAPMEALPGPLYVSLDLDGLDPAFAPGVAHPEPGGLSTRDVVELLHRVRAPIAGIDIVEYNPLNDHRDLTARVAAKLLKEALAVARRLRPPLPASGSTAKREVADLRPDARPRLGDPPRRAPWGRQRSLGEQAGRAPRVFQRPWKRSSMTKRPGGFQPQGWRDAVVERDAAPAMVLAGPRGARATRRRKKRPGRPEGAVNAGST